MHSKQQDTKIMKLQPGFMTTIQSLNYRYKTAKDHETKQQDLAVGNWCHDSILIWPSSWLVTQLI